MAINNEIGKKGESLAVEFLRGKGYEILETNYRYKRAEIDIIAKNDGLLVFIEVKARSSTEFGMPEDFVDEKKAGLVYQAAENYLEVNNWKADIRFDIVSVTMTEPEEIMHIKDAF